MKNLIRQLSQMKHTITHSLIMTVSTLIISVGRSFGDEVLSYETFVSDITLNNSIQDAGTIIEEKVENTIDMVNKFCVIYDSGKKRYNEDIDYLYDPAQSLFMMLLCGETETASAYLQHTERRDYGVVCEAGLGVADGNECSSPLHENIDTMYHTIVGDLVDSMTAQSYGYTAYSSTGDEIKIDDLSYYFLKTFGSKRAGDSGLCDKNKKANCIIPQTRERLVSYLKKARQLIQKRKRIQQTLPKNSKLPCDTPHKEDGTYPIIACGLQKDATILDMHQLISNELIRYTTFVNYYAYQLENDINLQPHTNNNISTDDKLTQGKKQAYAMLQKHQAATQATTQSMQHVAQIKTTFPVHIHLLAYYEITKKVRNRLAKIYTPLHQLYYKLRNVQAQG